MMWEKVKIGDVYEGLYDGPHATPPTSDDGAIFLGISNITKDGHIDLSDIKYINENDLPKWTKRCCFRLAASTFQLPHLPTSALRMS